MARFAAVVGVVGLLLAGLPGTAHADRPVVREHGPGSDSANFELCGLPVHSEETYSGPFTIRPAPGSDEAFLAHDTYQYTNVFTLDDADPSTDEFVRVEAHINYREQKATLVNPSEPNIYEFKAVEASHFRVYGTDGALLNRTAGVVKSTVVFDTLGDGEPGGIPLSELTVEHGYPHGVDFCTVLVAELT